MPGCGARFPLGACAWARGEASRPSVPITAMASRNDCFIRFTSLENSMRCEALDQGVIRAVEIAHGEPRCGAESGTGRNRESAKICAFAVPLGPYPYRSKARLAFIAPPYRQRLPGRS